jgi:anti-sigma factor RsiW
MTCREFIEFIDSYLDDGLTAGEKVAFRFHLTLCGQCRGYLDSYKKTIALGKAALKPTDDPVPSQVPADLVKAILASRREKPPE